MADGERGLVWVRYHLEGLISARTSRGGWVPGDAVRYEQLLAAEADILRREGLGVQRCG